MLQLLLECEPIKTKMKIYASIFSLTLFSIICNGVSQEPLQGAPIQGAPISGAPRPGGKYCIINVFYSINTQRFTQFMIRKLKITQSVQITAQHRLFLH